MRLICTSTRVVVDPQSLFDVQIKRIHEYKRQLLSVFYIIDAYLSMVEDGTKPTTPRTWVFGGKAAPGYYMAKRIIKLINNLADIINNDPRVEGMLKVAYVPDYRVSVAEKIVPAADLSEQISTAGFEASGTGNMKLSMNGALTIGTLDGANVEILEEVGKENIYIFGLSVEQVEAYRINGYNPRDWYNSDRRLARVLDAIRSDRFCPREPGYFIPIFDNLMNGGDFYLVMADFADYRNTQEIVGEDYLDQSTWAKKAILNVARMGKFSSDRTIQQYADDIWNVKRIPAVG
ncbi:MAG: glycogen/starch/alpha-glucan phosphorylase [Pseudomonadota bacterium]